MKIIILTYLCLILFHASINAQIKIVPIVEMNIGGLVGGVENGKWAAPRVGKTLKRESEFVLVGWKGVEEGGASLGSKSEPEIPCQQFYPVKLDLEMDSGVAIGSEAKWNPAPRIPAPIDLKSAVYMKAVGDVLKTKTITAKTVKLTQAFTIDLEGDGQNEVLLTATSYAGDITPKARKGDYSLVMLRKIVVGKAQNIIIKGDFVTKNIEFGAPHKFEISSIADFNGDGRMEIVIFGQYYEGAFAEVYEIEGNKPAKVLETGCGL